MSKEIYISSTPHETRLAIVEKDELSEIYYERENEYTLAGSIYNGRVTRVLPGMQSAFVDVGLERDAFLYITDFLEEQGESADFEGGGEPRRQSSGGGERSSGERSSGERSSGERSSGERSGGERGRGDRDRGERDRGERGGRGREQGREAAPEIARVTEPVSAAPEPERGTERGSESGEEGAPEGSRVWRGRRGRRRGRGGEPKLAAPSNERGAVTVEDSEVIPENAEVASPIAEMYGQAEEMDVTAPADRTQTERPREDRGGRGGRDRDRGGRGRERSGGRDRSSERGPRHEASGGEETAAAESGPASEPMILPGESLSKYRRGEESGGESSATLKPKSQANMVVARPSTEFKLTAGWDGGAVLPGETLSRHRGAASAPAAAPMGRSEAREQSAPEPANEGDETGRNRRRDRDARRGRGGRPERTESLGGQESAPEEPTPTSFYSGVVRREALDPSEAVQPGVTSQHEPEGTSVRQQDGYTVGRGIEIGGSDDAPGFETKAFEARQDAEMALAQDVEYVPETDYVAAEGGGSPALSAGPTEALLEAVQQMHETVAAAAESPAVHGGEEFHEETMEYEPGEEASASYRVDPAGPSEFRQGNLVEDDLNSADVRFEEGSEVSQEGPGHEFTAIQASGEMLSELPGEIMVPGAESDSSNPIEHETAVQSMHLGDVDGMLQPDAAPAQAAVPRQAHGAAAPAGFETAPAGFAPGEGQLEEELLDEDEDGDLFSMSGSAGDDTEEEVLEAGAEIGSLVRDRALDHMTHGDLTLAGEDVEDDEFDIDEEDLEEDELDGSEEIAGGGFDEGEDEEEDDRLEIGDAPFEEEEGDKPAAAVMGEFPEFTEEGAGREPGRGRGGEGQGGEGRRDGRRSEGRDRGGRGGRAGRDSRGMANSRGNGGRTSRHSVQNSDMPAITDLLKPGQEVLVQIAKEPIAKKGARITSHIALPGRFLVFMPTVNHVGVSRKIESDGERRRLKEVLLNEKGEAAGGFIVRTAAFGASEEELRSDLRFLLNLWADIKQRSEASKSPALIYHDLNLVERILRDQVTDNFSAIWVDTEAEYERVLRFLQRFQPALMRRVKLYTKDTPLFEQFGITEEINKALHSKVWLKSGGSIVINQTEALVAIDINTGKFVGKTARLEDTIVKTNLDAIPEIVRQIRLRDLGGIIVIDFIDMDDRKNRARVLAALEEELKNDRAPSKVLQFNDFGLVAITRKRVKQSLERTLSTTCAICAGTGMTKSPVTVCNEIYIELRKMHKQLDKGDVMLRVNPEVVKQLKSGSGKWLQEMEEISGKTILVKSDPSLHPEQFDIH